GAGVEGADDHRPAVERLGDLLVDGALLLLGRLVGAVEEQELRTEEADAVGAELDGSGGVGGRADVHGHLDRRTIAQRGGLPRARASARVALFGLDPGAL